MNHATSLFLGLCLIPSTLCAQQSAAEKEVLDLLAGGTKQQWSVAGTKSAPTGGCAAGEAYYTFQRTPAQLVVQECTAGAWKPRTVAYTTWTANGRTGITYGGASFEVKALHAGAPVCKGSTNCVRLSSLPDGKTDVTTNIYLTR